MKPLKIAFEYERGLHYSTDFTVANLAPEFLKHSRNLNENGEPKWFHEEGTGHQTEYNSKPSSCLDELCRDCLKAESISDFICQQLGVVNIPISENGAGTGKLNPEVCHRICGYKTVLGENALNALIKISAIHLHIDQYPLRIVDQFNILTALRPNIAFTSTSPISYLGENSVNCHRYKLIADPVDGVFSAIPEETGYIISLQELMERDVRRHRRWVERFEANRRNTVLPPDYDLQKFLEAFPVERTGYPDIRFRQKGKEEDKLETFERRTNDTAPLDIVLAETALNFGYINRIMRENIPVSIASKPEIYRFTSKEVILPSNETIEHYTSLAIKKGLEDKDVRKYLASIADFAEHGLPENQRHYLDPYCEMLDSGKNLASQLLDYLGHKPYYSHEEAALANKWVWERHRRSVAVLQEKLKRER